MPTYSLKAPNGKTYEIEGPAGATQAQVQAEILRRDPSAGQIPKAPARQAQKAVPVRTRQQEIEALARREIETVRQDRKKAGFSISPQEEAMAAGAGNFLGLGPLASAGINYIGDVLAGRNSDFNQDLEVQRTKNRILQSQAPSQALAGEVLSGLVGGTGIAKGIAAGAGKFAASGSRVASGAGKALQAATQVKQGQRVRNAARIVGAGAAGGAAQAAGEGSDIGTGAAYGAGSAAALVGGAKAAGWLGRKAADVARLSGVDSILRKYTKITAEELANRAEQFRKSTKGSSEPTVYELLDLEDRQNLAKAMRLMPGSAREQVSGLTRQRVASIPADMSKLVQKQTARQKNATSRTLASDLAASRKKTVPTPEERTLAKGATESPTRLAQLRRQEARNIMEPYDQRTAYNSVDELIPVTPMQGSKPGSVVMKIDDPEVAKAIQSAAGSLKLRPQTAGITIREITGIIQELKDDLGGNVIERGTAQRAITYLEDLLAKDHPDVLPALEHMNTQWAARSRQLEGMGELRLQQRVPASTPKQLQKSENVFETPEGATGRFAGQRSQLTEDLGQATQPALGTVRELAESPMVAQGLTQNLGRAPAQAITEAARVQSESARRLASVVTDPKSDLSEVEAGDLALLASALNPQSMAYTKFRAIADVSRFLRGIPESRARAMVDMLFSQDPKLTQRAINAMRKEGDQGREALRATIGALVAGSVAGGQDGGASDNQDLFTEPVDGGLLPEDTGEGLTGSVTDTSEMDSSPESDNYAAQLQALYDYEDPALLDLVERVQKQESGSQGQSAVSPAGAIGVMQVMPGTAPEAAQLAGVPFDEEAYRNDANYNKLIGIAYLSEMLRKYDGNVELALAAYNAGPGAVDDWLAGRRNSLPAETRDYVAKIS